MLYLRVLTSDHNSAILDLDGGSMAVEEMSVAARYIKQDVDELVTTWGIPAILEVLRNRIEIEMVKEGEEDQYKKLKSLSSHLRQAETLAD